MNAFVSGLPVTEYANPYTAQRRVGIAVDADSLLLLPSMPNSPISSKEKARNRARLLKKAMPEITTDTMKRTLQKLHHVEGDSSDSDSETNSQAAPYSSSLYTAKIPGKTRSKVTLQKPKVLLAQKPSKYTEQCQVRRTQVQTHIMHRAVNRVLEAEREEETATERRLLSQQSAARDAAEKLIKRVAVKRVAKIFDKAIGIVVLKEVKLRIAERERAEIATRKLLVIHRCWRKWRWRSIVSNIRKLGRDHLQKKKEDASDELCAYRLRIAQRRIAEDQELRQHLGRQRLKEHLTASVNECGDAQNDVYPQLIKQQLTEPGGGSCSAAPSVTLTRSLWVGESGQEYDSITQELIDRSIVEGGLYEDSWADEGGHGDLVEEDGHPTSSKVLRGHITGQASAGAGGGKRSRQFDKADLRTNASRWTADACISSPAPNDEDLGRLSSVRFSSRCGAPSPRSSHGRDRHGQLFDGLVAQYAALGDDLDSNSLVASYQKYHHVPAFDKLKPFYSHENDSRIFQIEDTAQYSESLQPFVDQMNDKIHRMVLGELTEEETAPAVSFEHAPSFSQTPVTKPVTPPAVKRMRRPTSKSKKGGRKTTVAVKKKKGSILVKSKNNKVDVSIRETKLPSGDTRPNTSNMVGLNDGNGALLSSSIPLVVLQNHFGVSTQPTSVAKRMLYEQIYSTTTDLKRVNNLLMTEEELEAQKAIDASSASVEKAVVAEDLDLGVVPMGEVDFSTGSDSLPAAVEE